jgi:hypothetical protein
MPGIYGVRNHGVTQLGASLQPDASLRADLESDRVALATLARQVEAVLAQVHPPTAADWHGSASTAFERALTALCQEIAGAAELVRAAERFTAAAISED